MRRDLTQGSVLKNVVLFSLPYLLSYFLQTLYGRKINIHAKKHIY